MAEVWAIVDENARPFCGYTALDGFEDNSTANVPTEPQENGALYAYDKVPQPSECSVSLLFSVTIRRSRRRSLGSSPIVAGLSSFAS